MYIDIGILVVYLVCVKFCSSRLETKLVRLSELPDDGYAVQQRKCINIL